MVEKGKSSCAWGQVNDVLANERSGLDTVAQVQLHVASLGSQSLPVRHAALGALKVFLTKHRAW